MGYVKLFESILESTVWQEDLHVKIVWITILAMKDRDGVVAASVPGLARRAGVNVQQCEDALNKFLAPDKYSRTKEHEGRRIEAIDGGWYVLNHDKYRDLLDADDQREKAAERQRRKRERDAASRDVTPGHALSRDVRDADADPDLSPPSSKLPDSDGRAIPPCTEPVADAAADLQHKLEQTAQQLADDEPARRARNAVADAAWTNLNRLRREVAAELGLAGVRDLHVMDQGRRQLSMRLRECPSLAEAEESVAHVLAVISAEARASRTVQWLSGSAFEERSWRTAIAKTVADAARPRHGPRSDSRGTPIPDPNRRKSKAL